MIMLLVQLSLEVRIYIFPLTSFEEIIHKQLQMNKFQSYFVPATGAGIVFLIYIGSPFKLSDEKIQHVSIVSSISSILI
jgi:hypothetical protein